MVRLWQPVVTVHGFEGRFAYADEPETQARVGEILVKDLGALNVERANERDDKAGVDFWAIFRNGTKRGIDIKRRGRDYGDFLVELVSRVEENKPGWTVDEGKLTDYVLILWPRSHLLLPMHLLRTTSKRMGRKWLEWYGETQASSKSTSMKWQTKNVAVPMPRLFLDMFNYPAPIGTPLTADRACPSCYGEHPVGVPCPR